MNDKQTIIAQRKGKAYTLNIESIYKGIFSTWCYSAIAKWAWFMKSGREREGPPVTGKYLAPLPDRYLGSLRNTPGVAHCVLKEIKLLRKADIIQESENYPFKAYFLCGDVVPSDLVLTSILYLLNDVCIDLVYIHIRHLSFF